MDWMTFFLINEVDINFIKGSGFSFAISKQYPVREIGDSAKGNHLNPDPGNKTSYLLATSMIRLTGY